MASPSTDDLRKFAEKVERLCEFLLNSVESEDSPDQNVLRDLKKDAADFQHVRIEPRLDGLDNFLRGLPK